MLSFFEKKERRGWLFSGTAEREWERWIIKLNTCQAPSTASAERLDQLKDEQEKSIQSCLLYITTMASEYREHVPGEGRLSYRITLPQTVPESWSGIIGKLISDTASTNVLG